MKTTIAPAPTLTLKEVAALLHVNTTTLRGWVKAGKFPPPLGFSRRKQIWSARAVEKALEAKS